MLGVNDLFIRPDNGIHVLEENNPRQHWMRKSRFLRFCMVLAKITGGVKKLLWNNRRLDANRISAKENCLPVRPQRFRPFFQRVFEGLARSVQTAIAILE